ncbi:MAG TPA: glycosyltransferase family 2 protein [Polyangiaceae bacterium]|nr:glycosyltransferase family 2 protein [Polyangiaceae bacterium]
MPADSPADTAGSSAAALVTTTKPSSGKASLETSSAPAQLGAFARLVDFVVRGIELLGAPYRRVLERLQLGNLARRLRPSGDLQEIDGQWLSVGPDPNLLLPAQSYSPGFYVMVLHVRGPSRRGYAKLYVDDGSGLSEDRAYGLVTKQEKSVFRIVHLPAGAQSLRLDPSEEAGPHEVPVFRFHRVPHGFAWRRMLRRLRLEHARLGGSATPALRAAISQLAHDRRLTPDAALFRLYHETFGQRRTTGDYSAWITLVEGPANAELEPWPSDAPGPLLSVLVPTYQTPPDLLRACLDSVLSQDYPHFELCVVDDASPDPRVREVLTEYAACDPRVKLHLRAENGHICRTTNDALALANGEWMALLDHDDLLTPHALLRVARSIEASPDAKLFYSDEDKLGEDGARKDPHFKSQFNPDLLLSQAYMGHLVVARTSEVRAIGGFRLGYEGSQDHDLVLRLSERCAPGEIVHIPWILYHWREVEGSTAQRADAKGYTAQAGLRAVQDALDRRGLAASADHAPLVPHGYRVRYALPAEPPLVSLLIPTRDKADLLRLCLGSILEKTTYPNYEVLIIDNGSVEAETFAYFEQISSDARVRVLRDDSPFNFSALNNHGARESRGELIGLVNNDIEAIDGDWLTEMVGHALRPEIGCVGAKLLYPDDRIQHAGVITGIGGVAGHAHKYLHKDEPGYHSRLRLTHALSAVTAACLLVRRSVFDQVGGLDETLAVAFNDVDFCLRVREAGYRNLFTPYAVLYHHESASRGGETTPAQRARFARETETMKLRWAGTLRRDPYYSPHLTQEHENFSL